MAALAPAVFRERARTKEFVVPPHSVSIVGKNAFRGCPCYTTYRNEPAKTTLNGTIAPSANKKSGCYIATAVDKCYDRVGIEQTFDNIIKYQIAGTVSIESVPAAVCASLHAQYAP